MSSLWAVQSSHDKRGILRTSPHQIAETCACLSGVRTVAPAKLPELAPQPEPAPASPDRER